MIESSCQVYVVALNFAQAPQKVNFEQLLGKVLPKTTDLTSAEVSTSVPDPS